MKAISIDKDRSVSADLPPPLPDERPAHYAERIGAWYAAATSAGHKKELGQYLTPVAVADFMARAATFRGRRVRILEPGAGAGVLAAALCEALVEKSPALEQIDLEVYETDGGLAGCLHVVLTYLGDWLAMHDIRLDFTIHTEDFVLKNAAVLNDAPQLFADRSDSGTGFDIVVMNPPYFKIPKSDPRAQAASTVVHGQPNIYAIFMAIGAAMLKPEGELIAITPRSFAAGPYFRRFREHFFAMMQPHRLHLFGSRRDAFSRDEILQENLVLVACRKERWWEERRSQESVKVSTSAGITDVGSAHERNVPLDEIMDTTGSAWILRIPVSEGDDAVTDLVSSWPCTLRSYGLAISTGPVVAFRAEEHIVRCDEGGTCAPLLWMQNVQTMRVEWPVSTRNKPQHITISPDSMTLLLPTRNYVVMRRFSAKEDRRRIVAAPFIASQMSVGYVGLENHLNYIHRPGGSLSEDEAYGLAALLGSDLIDRYFRISNGNTQVSATELRALPLPPFEQITALGRRVRVNDDSDTEIDLLVNEIIRCPYQTGRPMHASLLTLPGELRSGLPVLSIT